MIYATIKLNIGRRSRDFKKRVKKDLYFRRWRFERQGWSADLPFSSYRISKDGSTAYQVCRERTAYRLPGPGMYEKGGRRTLAEIDAICEAELAAWIAHYEVSEFTK